jgi:hypothetical protein
VKHKTHFIQDICLHRKAAWIKSQLESDAMPDPSALSRGIHRRLHEVVIRLKGIVSIPTGYEDERGFHFGEPPNK